MTSHAPGFCCYKGVKHEGQPVGSISTVKNFEVYTSYPENKSTEYAVLLLTDAMGHTFNDAQLIADQFAANGFFAFMPDLFHSDPVPPDFSPDFDFTEWLKSHGQETVDPIVEASITELRGKYKKIAAVGYSFGAKYVVHHLHPKQKKIDVGQIVHPSLVETDELEAIDGPLSILAAETDINFPPEKRHQSEIILKETGLPYQINLYGGVVHGFAVRVDLSDKVAKYAKESAFLQAVAWLEEHLKN